jgi:hypothetical protein
MYAAVWTSRHPIDAAAERTTDGIRVDRITSSLEAAARISGKPERLAANLGISFQGSNILGLGFTIEPERAYQPIAEDPRNADVLFPYLNGQDLNSRPDCSASRWVINFHDWPKEKAKTYPELYAQVLSHVKPERDANKRKVRRERWWQYAELARGLYEAIARFDRMIVIAQNSSTQKHIIVPTSQVFDQQLVVFATNDTSTLALLSSALHYWWTIKWGSSMKGDQGTMRATVIVAVRPAATVADKGSAHGGSFSLSGPLLTSMLGERPQT